MPNTQIAIFKLKCVAESKHRPNWTTSREGSHAMKPIRIFWSELGQRFYATRAYKEVNPTKNSKRRSHILVTGQKFDVTDDIASAIIKHGITFTKEKAEK